MSKNLQLFIWAFVLIFVGTSCVPEHTEPDAKVERGKLLDVRSTIEINANLISAFINSSFPEYSSSVNPQYTISLTSFVYETVDANGNEITCSGVLGMPIGTTKPAPLLSFQRGTILRKDRAPSNALTSTLDNQLGLKLNTGSGFEIAAAFASEGYIVAVTDMLGMGQGTGIHPYVHAKTEATSVVDMLRASKTILNFRNVAWNGQLFLMGYSQGGHATVAAQREIEMYHEDEFTVTASAPMAGPYDLDGAQLEALLQESVYPEPSFAPYVMYGLNSVYNMYPDISSKFKTEYSTYLNSVFQDPISQTLQEVSAQLPSVASQMFTDEFLAELQTRDTNQPFISALSANDVTDWTPKSPMIRLYHCENDLRVTYENSVILQQELLKKGVSVDIYNQENLGVADDNHITCIIPSILHAKNWFDTMVE